MQTAALKAFPLSLQQSRLWALQSNGQFYQLLGQVLLEGPLHLPRLEQALQQVQHRHTILRTTSSSVAGLEMPLQAVVTQMPVACPLVQLQELAPEQQQEQIEQHWQRLQQEPIEVARGPLLRLCLLRLATQRHLLLVQLPALCADGATLRQFVADLSQTYRSGVQGETVSETPLQYADVSAWQNRLLVVDDADELKAYWEEQ